MVRIRYYEQDTPFGEWLRDRGKDGSLPSSGAEVGITATDVDMVVNCYKNRSTGKEVKCIFWIEVKTRNGGVRFAQSQTFQFVNAFAGVRHFAEMDVRFYGVIRLRMSGTSPYDSEKMLWERWPWSRNGCKRLPQEKDLLSTVIDEEQLKRILRCELHPCSLRPWTTEKDHHGKTVTYETEKRELLDVEVKVTKRY